jgi:hypothetical protein
MTTPGGHVTPKDGKSEISFKMEYICMRCENKVRSKVLR